MRIERSVTSLSWIPSEAVTGLNKAVFESGFTHYDDPPPDEIDDLTALQAADRFRFANHLVGWIDIEDGDEDGDDTRIFDAGYSGGCLMGATTLAVGSKRATFAAIALDDIRLPVDVTATSARFVQTVGGHTGVPAPRRVSKPPFVQLSAPTVWSTMALTIHVDGTSEFELLGASRFPRHWVYDHHGRLAAKVGMADFKEWWRNSFGSHTPWGDEDSPALVTAVETALERELSTHIMRGDSKPTVRSLRAGEVLVEKGDPADRVFLLLDGVVGVEVDGELLTELGPGAIFGERAGLEDGRRTATLRAVTKIKVASVSAGQLDPADLHELSAGHRREDDTSLVAEPRR